MPCFGILNVCLQKPDSMQKLNPITMPRKNVQNVVRFCCFGPTLKYPNISACFGPFHRIELIPFALSHA